MEPNIHSSSNDMAGVTSRQPDFVARELLRLYDAGKPFFTKDVLSKMMRQAETLDECGWTVVVEDLVGDNVYVPVGVIGNTKKEAIDVGMFSCEQRETAQRVIDEDMAKNGIQPSGHFRSDLDNLSQPALRKLYEIVVEKLPNDRARVQRMPQLEYRTINALFLKADYKVNLKPPMAFLPAYLASIKNLVPFPDGHCQEQFCDELRQYQAAWERSIELDRIMSMLNLRELPRMRKIVGFECTDKWKATDEFDDLKQLGFMLALRQYLESSRPDNGPLACFVQGSFFSESVGWTNALKELGVTLLVDPQAFLELDMDTVVVSLASTLPVRQITADLTRPAMMFWRSCDNEPRPPKESILAQRPDDCDPSSPRVAQMHRDEYLELVFPPDAMPGAPPRNKPLGIFIRRYPAD